MFCQKTAQDWCTSERGVMMKLQSPAAHSCGLLNHSNTFCRGMFKLNTKFGTDLLLYLLSHFECESHTVHMLIQQHLLPPLTSAVKLSLFTHALSSLLSLAARVHPCHANHSLYINHCQTFSWQTSYFNYINTILLALYFWIKLLKDDIPILSLFGLVDMYYLSS